MMVEPIHWLILFIVLLAVEIMTMGLTTIWFAGGSIGGLVVNLLGGNIWIQIIVFLAVSFVLLVFTRPIAARYINRGRTKTNVDELVGQNAVVTEEIDNLKGQGKVKVKGMDWSARTKTEGAVIADGTEVEILSVEGVKLIVKEKK